MNFVSPELNIHEIKLIDSNRIALHFKFIGKFTQQTSIAGSRAWTQFMDENPPKEFEFVWDCTEMTGFELSARKEWYNAMQGYKHRIAKAYVISEKIMIRSAAKVMLQLFNIPSKVYKSGEELPKAIQHS